jgi:hypothetical protein
MRCVAFLLFFLFLCQEEFLDGALLAPGACERIRAGNTKMEATIELK